MVDLFVIYYGYTFAFGIYFFFFFFSIYFLLTFGFVLVCLLLIYPSVGLGCFGLNWIGCI